MRPSPRRSANHPALAASVLFALAPVAVLLAASCADAPADEAGGGLRFDPTPAATAGDGGCGDPNADAGQGDGWNDLYRDYFGPTQVSSCAGSVGNCHGETTGQGYLGSGFLCAGGASGCYTGITSPTAALVIVGDTTDDPTTSGLYEVLRKACGGGEMPKAPATFTFSPADMKRIGAWIGAGAPAPSQTDN